MRYNKKLLNDNPFICSFRSMELRHFCSYKKDCFFGIIIDIENLRKSTQVCKLFFNSTRLPSANSTYDAMLLALEYQYSRVGVFLVSYDAT